MGRARQKVYEVTLPEASTEKAIAELARRGTTLDAFIRMKLKILIAGTKFYGLNDTYTFGKCRGERVEDVIRADPEYVAWCLREVDGFGLDPEALELLQDMDVDL